MSVETAEVDTGVDSEQLDAFAQADGGAETNVVDAGPDKTLSAAAKEFDLPEDFMKNALDNDPEMKALIEGKKPDVDKGGEDRAADDSSGEDSATDEQKQETKADEKDSGKEDAPAPFADDVIPGLKGEDFGKLPEEVQGAIAKFYQEAQEKTRKADSIAAAMDTLNQDPYLKSRIAALGAGMQMPPRGLSQQEENTIAAILTEKLGLGIEKDAGERAALAETIAALKPGIDAVAKEMAQEYAAQLLQTRDAINRTDEVNKQGNALLLGLSQFDKSLEVKESDLSNFYSVDPKTGKSVYNERHPEIEKYKNGIGKFVQWAFDRGIDNRQIVKMGAKAFFAAAGADLGKAVAINTADRDKKIAAEARRSAISLFRKTGSGTLATQGSAPAGKANTYSENGIDAVKLATDGAYFDELIAKKPGDKAWIDKLGELESKGRAIINRKQAR